MPFQYVLADEAADVAVSAPDLLADSFRRFERYRVELDTPGRWKPHPAARGPAGRALASASSLSTANAASWC